MDEEPGVPPARPAVVGDARPGAPSRAGDPRLRHPRALLVRERWSGSALNLGAFRITVFGILLSCADVYRSLSWADLPLALRIPPYGMAWAAEIPLSPGLARILLGILLVSSVFALVGFHARTAAALAALSGLIVLALPQFSGSVLHYHHLIWFALLLAASPCGDALSVDGWLARRRGQSLDAGPSPAYGVPLRAAWLLVAFIFLFPGLAKWRESGLAWAFSDNLINQMHWKWYQLQWVPLLRVDRLPRLCQAAALGVMLFEPGFALAILFRQARPWAVLAAMAFHLGTDFLMGIRFTALLFCYAVFIDWARLARRLGVVSASPSVGAARAAWPAVGVAALLIVGNAWCGIREKDQAWPFACYPTFAQRVGPRMPKLAIEADGQPVNLDAELLGRAQQLGWGEAWAVGARADPGALAAYWRQVASRQPELKRATSIRFFVEWISVTPEDWHQPPIQRRLLAHLQLEAS